MEHYPTYLWIRRININGHLPKTIYKLKAVPKEYPFMKQLKIIFMKLIWNNRRSETVKAILGKKNQLDESPSQTSDYTILLYTKLEQYKQCGTCTKLNTYISKTGQRAW